MVRLTVSAGLAAVAGPAESRAGSVAPGSAVGQDPARFLGEVLKGALGQLALAG